jgi:transcriptional regulator with XRE-family HTH domain
MTTTDTTSQRVTQAQLARELGVTRQAIGDLVNRRVLALGADGKLDLAEAREIIRERVRPSAKTAGVAGSTAGAGDAPPATADASASYFIAKAQREVTEAQIAALRLQQMQGELIDRDAAIQATFTAFRTLRDTINYLPRQLAGQLVGLETPRQAQQLLEGAIRDTLQDFQSKVLAAMARRLGSQAPVEEGPAQ